MAAIQGVQLGVIAVKGEVRPQEITEPEATKDGCCGSVESLGGMESRCRMESRGGMESRDGVESHGSV
jgi:hypothetical protein